MCYGILICNIWIQVIDLATSLAKVADVDRNLGNESTAIEGFEEAIQCLEKLKLDSEQASLERRVAIIDPHYSSSHPVSVFLN